MQQRVEQQAAGQHVPDIVADGGGGDFSPGGGAAQHGVDLDAPGVIQRLRDELAQARAAFARAQDAGHDRAGTAGGLFPALDAGLALTPQGAGASLLKPDGVYRPPLGTVGAALDRAILHRVATATIRTFVAQVADAIVSPEVAAQCGRARQRWQLLAPAAEAEE